MTSLITLRVVSVSEVTAWDAPGSQDPAMERGSGALRRAGRGEWGEAWESAPSPRGARAASISRNF